MIGNRPSASGIVDLVNTAITRRAMLAAWPAVLAAQTMPRSRSKAKPQIPNVGEFVRFPDPTTETFVVRLTSLKSSAFLPSPVNRFVSVKDRYLIFSSDRNGGALAPYKVDLHDGTVRQLASTSRLNPQSLSLDAKEQWLYFLDGGNLRRAEVAAKYRQTAAVPVAQNMVSFSLAPDNSIFALRANGDLVRLTGAQSEPAVWASAVHAASCLAQPGSGSGCLFTRAVSASENEFWYLAPAAKPLLLAKGAVSNPVWSPQGDSLLFLRDVPGNNAVVLSEIHSVALPGAAEVCLASTSQFAAFAVNFDGSVFVGASRSKAQPNIVLLLRSAKREMTLCQHRASHPAAAAPAFSPDARRVYFASDEEGKPAIYSINVEQLVEPPSSTDAA